ncbi:hypothetical protein A5659_03640 [Mycobacterium sp. 1165196.3]|uniref:hypothetical protein n=1 Tax=Mycobacterium sp. 1165196.3 TaxID=1834071 RepID=UPI0007FF4EF3|nr:hypothetical protein [Mycobacterium sp. 1165196.3]OBK30146.1 hypothetical protein A5659_03640 [Mycobacterium sp. 1165196.3]
MADEHELEIEIFPYPNPALTELLVSDDMGKIVGEYGQKVETVFRASIAGRERKGDPHPGLMSSEVYSRTYIGGMKDDRYVCDVGSNVDYMSADEWGRKSRNPYAGHHDLRNALYSVLPYQP